MGGSLLVVAISIPLLKVTTDALALARLLQVQHQSWFLFSKNETGIDIHYQVILDIDP